MTVHDIIPRLSGDSDAEGHQRLTRLAALDPDRMAMALTWLTGYSPAVFDATLDATEPCTDDDTPDPAANPEPFCLVCGADVGIFLRFGLNWRHYRGDGTTADPIELFDPGHAPVIAWRPDAEASESAERQPRSDTDWARKFEELRAQSVSPTATDCPSVAPLPAYSERTRLSPACPPLCSCVSPQGGVLVKAQ